MEVRALLFAFEFVWDIDLVCWKDVISLQLIRFRIYEHPCVVGSVDK